MHMSENHVAATTKTLGNRPLGCPTRITPRERNLANTQPLYTNTRRKVAPFLNRPSSHRAHHPTALERRVDDESAPPTPRRYGPRNLPPWLIQQAHGRDGFHLPFIELSGKAGT